jgi:hypothetical protein
MHKAIEVAAPTRTSATTAVQKASTNPKFLKQVVKLGTTIISDHIDPSFCLLDTAIFITLGWPVGRVIPVST